MAKIDTSFEGLFNLLLETRYLHACPKDLRIFLKQQGLSGQHDMVIMSDNFLNSKPREFNRPSDVQSTGMRYNSNSNQHSFQQAPVSSRPPQTSSEYNATPRNYVGARQSQPPTCFLCAKVGHIAKDCRVQSPRADVNKRNTQPAHIGSVAIVQQSAHTISWCHAIWTNAVWTNPYFAMPTGRRPRGRMPTRRSVPAMLSHRLSSAASRGCTERDARACLRSLDASRTST